MVTLELVRELYRHMEWADARVWRAALGAGAPDDEVRERLFHIHRTQQAFLELWRGEPLARSDAKELPLERMLAWARPWYRDATDYLGTLRDGDLARPLPMPWSTWYAKQLDSTSGPTTLGETLLQVAMHTQHHRGQLNMRLRHLGAPPPMVDYIAWLWSGRPTPDWPA
jgi:uncharacterized damage-inducible protein DinB